MHRTTAAPRKASVHAVIALVISEVESIFSSEKEQRIALKALLNQSFSFLKLLSSFPILILVNGEDQANPTV